MGLQRADHEVVIVQLCILHRQPHDACVHGDGRAECFIFAAAIQHSIEALVVPPGDSQTAIVSAACMACVNCLWVS